MWCKYSPFTNLLKEGHSIAFFLREMINSVCSHQISIQMLSLCHWFFCDLFIYLYTPDGDVRSEERGWYKNTEFREMIRWPRFSCLVRVCRYLILKSPLAFIVPCCAQTKQLWSPGTRSLEVEGYSVTRTAYADMYGR